MPGNDGELRTHLGQFVDIISNHTLMHGGQIQVIRRVLGKPILF